MSTISDQDTINQVTHVSQVILGTLIAGVLVFLGIAVMIDLGPNRPMVVGAGANAGAPAGGQFAPTGPFITDTAVVFAAVLLPLSFVLPNLITARNRRAIASGAALSSGPSGKAVSATGPQAAQTEFSKLTMLYGTQLIVGAALNEGLAFFASLAYLIEKNPIALGLALLLVAGLVVRFPTSSRIQRWTEQQREKLREKEDTPRSSYLEE